MKIKHTISYQGQKPFDIEQLLNQSQAKAGATTTHEGDMLCIEVPSERTMYYFTQPGHPIHPSVVIRTVVTKGDNIKINTKGHTSGDRTLFEQWLKQFMQQDVQIKKDATP